MIQQFFQLQQLAFFYAAETTQQALRKTNSHTNNGMELINGRGYPKQHFAQGSDKSDAMNVGNSQQIIEK